MDIQTKVWVCGRSFTGIADSIPAGGMDVLSVVTVVCCHAKKSAKGRSISHRIPAECGVSECDLETLSH